ncbi:lamin-like protein [Amborella trichopoda]|uniref:Phytocyanin domain-containing protein n=1 Tax=Amborella trichopoda TaxID=13333 RepID=W1PHC9_AMBTC|nr:lamin-like protein [Amborella trichopoda]ERN07036.1 hypothetical protein AMTR_s00019p00024490 [Amborella trichopoda]|eukprot:XP_006845361.1 lamin-like protein [Amborella trichopoda]
MEPALIFRRLFVAIVIFAVALPANATDHIVGDNHGWNPGINYTLWAGNHTFFVGDLISFRYQRNQYNVYMVNKTGYDNCTLEGALGNWSSGKDFIELNESKRYYFICGNGLCFGGMKVTVFVAELPTSPPPSHYNNHTSGAQSILRQFASTVPGILAGIFTGIWI